MPGKGFHHVFIYLELLIFKSSADEPIVRLTKSDALHCVKSVRIRSYSAPYSVQMRENKDQNNSEYGHFSHSAGVFRLLSFTSCSK